MKRRLKMIPEEVFHYTKAKTALNEILCKRQLKVGRFRCVNDPKESKAHVFKSFVSASPYNDPDYSSKDYAERYWKVVQRSMPIKLDEWRAVCFSKNRSSTELEFMPPDNPLFLSGACIATMWAHYTDGRKGVCMKFNGNKFDERIRNVLDKECVIRCGDMNYDDLRFGDADPSFSAEITDLNNKELEARLRRYFVENYQTLFLRKTKDWASEREFRWLVNTQIASTLYIPIDGVVEEVFVGDNFPEEDYPSMIELCKGLGIRVSKIGWENGEPCQTSIISP
jgi:DUF2971 family protein